MRLVSFLVLSLALHATALVYPVSFYAPNQVQHIRVTILPMERESDDAGTQGAIRNAGSRNTSKSAGRAPRPVQPAVELNPTSNPEPQALPAETPAKFSNSSVALVSAIVNSPETDGISTFGSIGNATGGYGAAGTGTGGNGLGSSGMGSGLGNGQGSSGSGAVWIQARYKETPKPVYPESARREGREGRVLLRVLVDDQGRSKSVEVNSSSGNEALDRAAADAIKRWRFHPARYGDKAVESWLRVPIEFRLADAKTW
jgi:protein TonB